VEEAEFDKFAAEYRTLHAESIKASGESPEYFAEYKIIDVAAELARARGGAVERAAVLDFGAGVGYSVPFFGRHMPHARVTCLDVSQKSLDIGAATHGSAADFRHFDGKRIPYADGTFDVALASCVFHHIPHAEHVALLAEIRRVLAPRGLFLLHDWTRQPLQSYLAWRRDGLGETGPEHLGRAFRLFPVHNKYTSEDWQWLLAETGFAIRHQAALRQSHRMFVATAAAAG